MTNRGRTNSDVEDTPVAARASRASGPEIAGRRRVVIEGVQPQIDSGRFAIKRTIGESVTVTADVFGDGHDRLAGVLKYRKTPSSAPADPVRRTVPASSSVPADPAWLEIRLVAGDNDTWTASFAATELGRYEYTIEAWVDTFATWLHDLVVKADSGQDLTSELLEGAELVHRAGVRHDPGTTLDAAYEEVDVASGVQQTTDDDLHLLRVADLLRSARPQVERVRAARDPGLRALMNARPDRTASTVYDRVLAVDVDPARARFGAWYEIFPRSYTPDPSRSATFREVEARLPSIASMGFDVLYLAPIHPIGRTFRKGRNNSLTTAAGDPGSPWAIGSEAGGHTAIEPGLGTIEDFDRFVDTANRLGLEIALDIAFQASPDHPWVREHPEWFRHRPDGSIKYAENPPKKYQDIYPLNFDSAAWPSLWAALRDVFLFWIGHGVKIFRVDNPHTKSFRFWEWCIGAVRRDHPDTIFLAEAFTRPKIMRYLAKLGFSQSYTYFTWRNTAAELREYLTELTTTELREYMRPNFFANTPDILHEYLQRGGRPAFEVRLVLAAMLSASYGIYSGFELCEHVPVRPGSEEYLDSEKYEIKVRDWNAPGTLTELIARVNEIRRRHRALQQNATLRFHNTDNPALLWFSKTASAGPPAAPGVTSPPLPVRADRVFIVANTDPHWLQHGWIELPLDELGIPPDVPFVVEDLLDARRYTWRGPWNYVRLDPAERMAHVFSVDV